MLTLFILKSGKEHADAAATLASFGNGLVSETVKPPALVDIHAYLAFGITTPWYCVMHDNEQLDIMLQRSLLIFLTYTDADVLICYKKEREFNSTRAPRFFKKHVKIRADCLLPQDEGSVKFDTILNGWIV
uniref:Uncharacterized protein n=1 Tax=viral metagenome TaxID=1070528 RepID=A0A6M3LGY6_9ZZZZ